MTLKLNLFMSLLLITTISCAETPSPLVQVNQPSKNDEPLPKTGEGLIIQLDSVIYAGQDPFGSPCTMALAIDDEMHLWTQIDYKIHGLKASDTSVDFYQYNLSQNTFYGKDDKVAGALPALASVLAEVDPESLDVNKTFEYEQQGSLLQSVRIDFFDIDVDGFILELKNVTDLKTLPVNDNSIINSMDRLIVKIGHNGHYDAAICTNMKISGMEARTFSMGLDHDHDEDSDEHDDDHADDHDDDHQHDH